MSDQRLSTAIGLVLLVFLGACASSGVATRPAVVGESERGQASWYGEPYHGRTTASGETYDMHAMTAAHRTLDFGTVVGVTRRDTGASVEVRINDRGPFIRGRIIDLSYAAACEIGLDRDGVAPVEVCILSVHRDAAPRRQRVEEPSLNGICLWVQVGAFGDQRNAERARDRLVEDGEPVIVMEGPGGLHRVRVGPFDSAQQAEEARRRLQVEWPPAKVVECGG